MNESNKLLSDIVAFRTYAKYIPHLQRRETLQETINRAMNMHLEKFPKLSSEIIKSFSLVHDLKIMPSMRSMQFSGEAVASNNSRSYNCSFVHVSYERVFSEILFLLLSGVGVGYSVQKRHINYLPSIRKPKEEGYFRVHDSIEGWSQALHILMDSYFNSGIRPDFDFSAIRPKGSYLVTTGAKAPGSEPLRRMLIEVEKVLQNCIGRKLKPIEVHDINCLIADCVLSGGIRRAALISLFDKDDEEMLKCKSGTWWEKHPYRARSNNSVVLHRESTTKEEFDYIFKMCQDSNAGEPGIFWTNDYDIGCNPCAEISLNSNQFCNLVSINQTGITTEKEFFKRIRAATIIGTLQASYTNFPYISEKWNNTTEKEALLGVSFTGVADSIGFITPELLREGSKLVLQTNEEFAKKIGINLAARTTTVKPEGCFDPLTKIKTNKGILSLKDIFDLNGVNLSEKYFEENTWYDINQDIKVYDVNNEEQKITKLYINGIKDTLILEFEHEGKIVKIECTTNHKFFTKNRGWVEAKDLTEEDDILTY